MMRDIDFHLKYCILEGNLKLTASGRNPRSIYMGGTLQRLSSWLKRASNKVERVVAPKRGHVLKADVRGRLFSLVQGL